MYRIALCALALLLFFACQKPYTPGTVFEEPSLVVEGYVTVSDSGALPPYVVLTRSFDFFGEIGPATLNQLFVHDADVRVVNGSDTLLLQEFCLDELLALSPELAQAAGTALGLGPLDSLGLNVCVYTDPGFFVGAPGMVPVEGGRYDLIIQHEGQTISATTTIPFLVPLDSIGWVPHPDFPQNDSLVEVRAFISDPGNVANFYRSSTQRNQEPRYSGLQSVVDDLLFNGQSFEFPVSRAESRAADPDLSTFGYFWRGDTVSIRIGNIDFEHFRFWQTLEADTGGGQSPFSSYVRISSNVNGALGIWGGYVYRDYLLEL